ncbi:unnamed protein product [Toxocara canis]|uniref:asparaginase n=1 Tax=Toxocara canis TaxID=6265 RepID=A0A183V0G6_TOXCA|nr:unnamed protein product [Toxocara canis]
MASPQTMVKRLGRLKRDSKNISSPIDEYHTPKQLLIHTGSIAKVTSAAHLASVVSEDLATTATDNLHASESRIFVLYTGGTIGMKKMGTVYYPEPYYLACRIRELPYLNDQEYIAKNYGDAKVKPYCLPPLRLMKKRIVYWMLEYDPLLDSCDITFDDWIRIGTDIRKAYDQYDGFVILHGTDTLAYTASALSFMLENLGKPVVITGAQIPICEVRSDGRDNLIGALQIAGGFDIPEVTIYFNHKLLRGNRSTKLDNSHMEAFESPNMAPIADLGITISVNFESVFRSPSLSAFTVQERLCRDVSLLHIFPSMSINSVRAALQPPTQGVVLQSYGCGNIPSRRADIIAEIREAVQRGCIVVNCSQCLRGMVEEAYFTGKILYDVGVISGADMTIEAAMTKLMYVIGKDEWDLPTKRKMMQHNLRGEMTVARSETLHDLEIIPRLASFLRISSSQEVQLLRNALFPPLLCHAARNGDVELLENLRQNGAVLSAVDYNGRTPHHSFCRDQWGDSPLVNAIRRKNLTCIKALREADAVIVCNPVELAMELCLSASRGDIETIEAWITAGANVNEIDYDGRTALHTVCHLSIEMSPQIATSPDRQRN